MLSMILDLVLPVWRAQAHAIDLLDAALNGRVSELQEQMHLTEVDVNGADLSGRTPVYNAARNGHAEALWTLLRWGADPNIPNSCCRPDQNGLIILAGLAPTGRPLHTGHAKALRLISSVRKRLKQGQRWDE